MGDMVRPTARVLTLLEILQSGGTRTSAELAERLGVDERTVRRYVEHLCDLDVPVDSVRGRYGGYRLAGHYRMPPLMLTDEEALAVVWGLLLTSRSGSGPVSLHHVEAAAGKVRRVLPEALARRIDAVVETVDFTGGRVGVAGLTGGGEEEEGAEVLLGLAEAARDRRPIAFDYVPRHGRARQRTVHPHGIVALHGRLYLTAHDVERAAERTFRLDRIAGVRRLEGTFDLPDDLDPVQQVVGPLAPAPGRHDVSVLVRADVAQVRTLFPETLASVEPAANAAEGGWLRIFVRAERLEWVAGRLAALDRPFIIEQPEALHEAVAALGQKLIAAVGGKVDER